MEKKKEEVVEELKQKIRDLMEQASGDQLYTVYYMLKNMLYL